MMLSERGQAQKATYRLIPCTWNVQKRQIHRDRKQISGCQGLAAGGAGERRVTASWVRISFRGGEKRHPSQPPATGHQSLRPLSHPRLFSAATGHWCVSGGHSKVAEWICRWQTGKTGHNWTKAEIMSWLRAVINSILRRERFGRQFSKNVSGTHLPVGWLKVIILFSFIFYFSNFLPGKWNILPTSKYMSVSLPFYPALISSPGSRRQKSRFEPLTPPMVKVQILELYNDY